MDKLIKDLKIGDVIVPYTDEELGLEDLELDNRRYKVTFDVILAERLGNVSWTLYKVLKNNIEQDEVVVQSKIGDKVSYTTYRMDDKPSLQYTINRVGRNYK